MPDTFHYGAEPLESELRPDGLCVGNPSFGGITNTGADASKSEQVRMGICVGTNESSRQAGSLLSTRNGLDGSRTRVQRPIPCPSTSVVCSWRFPPMIRNKQPITFGSFMLRPTAQSFADVVSHIVEARLRWCGCHRSDYCLILGSES